MSAATQKSASLRLCHIEPLPLCQLVDKPLQKGIAPHQLHARCRLIGTWPGVSPGSMGYRVMDPGNVHEVGKVGDCVLSLVKYRHDKAAAEYKRRCLHMAQLTELLTFIAPGDLGRGLL